MSDNLTPVDSADKKTVSASGELLVNETHFASAFVTPFAVAVAVELEEFGLSKQKIDEIMLRAAKRFGAMNDDASRALGQQETDSDGNGADFLGWFKIAGGQAFDFLASVVVKHGPDLIDKLAPIVTDALQQAVSNYLKGATGSNGRTKSNPMRKSRR